MKKLWVFVVCCYALSAHALDFKGCTELASAVGLPPGHVLSAKELKELEKSAAAEGEGMWPTVWGILNICGLGVKKDVEKGMQAIQTASEAGGVLPNYVLASIYAGILGIPLDSAQATQWLRDSPGARMPEVQFVLGRLYAWDGRVPKNVGEAKRWLLKAASQGHTDAQNSLGVLYFEGGMYPEALPWLRLSAAQGKANAQFLLSNMYAYGWAVPKDASIAAQWLDKAVTASYAPAQDELKKKEKHATTQLRREREEAGLEAHLRSAVLDGTPESKLALAQFLEVTAWEQPRLEYDLGASDITTEGKAIGDALNRRMRERNQEAVDWLNRAAQQGSALAAFKLGTANWYASLGVSDEREGLRLIRFAAAQGYPDAIYWLARAYQQGTGLPISFVAAYALYFQFEVVQSQGAVKLASYVPPSDVSLNEEGLRRAQELAQALARPGQFLSALDSAVAGEKR